MPESSAYEVVKIDYKGYNYRSDTQIVVCTLLTKWSNASIKDVEKSFEGVADASERESTFPVVSDPENVTEVVDFLSSVALAQLYSSAHLFENCRNLNAQSCAFGSVWSTDSCEFVRTLIGHRRGIACLQYHDRLVVSGS
uniref:Uncharacterized protein n=1 Tax=Parascaris equorum TaxID=6256 RepID=A0A914S6G6_PAREQ